MILISLSTLSGCGSCTSKDVEASPKRGICLCKIAATFGGLLTLDSCTHTIGSEVHVGLCHWKTD